VIAAEKLWLTADRSALVNDGDERAAFLFCTPGKKISDEDAARLGVVDGRLSTREVGDDDQVEPPATDTEGDGVTDTEADAGSDPEPAADDVAEGGDVEADGDPEPASGLTIDRTATRGRRKAADA